MYLPGSESTSAAGRWHADGQLSPLLLDSMSPAEHEAVLLLWLQAAGGLLASQVLVQQHSSRLQLLFLGLCHLCDAGGALSGMDLL